MLFFFNCGFTVFSENRRFCAKLSELQGVDEDETKEKSRPNRNLSMYAKTEFGPPKRNDLTMSVVSRKGSVYVPKVTSGRFNLRNKNLKSPMNQMIRKRESEIGASVVERET